MSQVVFGPTSTSITSLLKESTPQDVRTYIDISHQSAEKVIGDSELPKLLGVATSGGGNGTGNSNGSGAASGGSGGLVLAVPKKEKVTPAPAYVPITAAIVPAAAAAKPKKSFSSPAPKLTHSTSASNTASAEYAYDQAYYQEEFDDPDFADYTPTNAGSSKAKRTSLATAGGK